MKLKYCLLIFLFVVTACSSDDSPATSTDQKTKLRKALQTALKDFPGISFSVAEENDLYTITSGYAVLEDLPMTNTSLHYMQSVSKTFTAAAVMKLKEEGLVSLDAPMKNYLSQDICNNITNGNVITVRQLLNMTSGIADYLDNPQFIIDVQQGNVPMSSAQILHYIYNKPAVFSPGSNAGYSNINYHLLSLIIDNLTGAHHSIYIQGITSSAGLSSVYYLPGSGLGTAPAGTTASYIWSGSNYDDISQLQFDITLSLPGDDGILATTESIAAFYKKLLADKSIISASSVNEMVTPVIVSGNPYYGMGLTYYTTPGGITGIGHPGSGAGAAAEAYYFPAREITIVIATNTGTLLDVEKEEKFQNLLNKIAAIVVDNQ